MSKLRKIVRMMLCLPLAPIIGVGGVGGSGSGSESGNNNQNNQNNSGDNQNNNNSNNDDSNSNNGAENDSGNNNNNLGERMFSQAELNKLLKAEKEKSKTALLKELGVEDFNTAKDGLAKYLESVENSKTDLQKSQEENKRLSEQLAQKTGQAKILQASLDAISLGVNPESVSDIVPIVLAKTDSENDVKSVIEELKKNPAFSGFFKTANNSNNNSGTGNPIPKNQNPNNGAESYGARLAKSRVRNNLNSNSK